MFIKILNYFTLNDYNHDMLTRLYISNIVLIEKLNLEFGAGLNILTGETGAGKSIVIGSVNAALGGKVSKDMIRQGADSAYIELIFSVDDPEKRRRLEELDVELPEDGTLIVSRKITPSRSSRTGAQPASQLPAEFSHSHVGMEQGICLEDDMFHLWFRFSVLISLCREPAGWPSPSFPVRGRGRGEPVRRRCRTRCSPWCRGS